MHIGILGPGRLGGTLAHLLREAGWQVDLAGRDDPLPSASALLLAVPDGRIAEVAASIPLGRTLLHCSGASDLVPLRPHHPAGSFHPLMTFPGLDVAIPELSGVPAALAGDPEAIAVGRAIAAALGMAPLEVPGDRALYHCAAVMAGNFATVLLAEAAAVLEAAGVPRDQAAAALAPLALTSLQNAAQDPVSALTGPAARGDHATIRRHLEALAAHDLDDSAEIYEVLNRAAIRIARQRARVSDAGKD